MAPAALTQSLGQLRLKMADQNRLAQVEMSEQRAELQALAADLAAQRDKITAERQGSARMDDAADDRDRTTGRRACVP